MKFTFSGIVGPNGPPPPLPKLSWDDQLDQRAAMGGDVTSERAGLAAMRERVAQIYAESFVKLMDQNATAHGVDRWTWLGWSAEEQQQAFIAVYQPRESPSGQPVWTQDEIEAESAQHVWMLVRFGEDDCNSVYVCQRLIADSRFSGLEG